jgi:hypothetical protein
MFAGFGDACGLVIIAHMSLTTPDEPRVSRQPVMVQAQSRWIAPIALGIAVIAIGVAVWALVSTWPSNSPAPTAQQAADAKNRACAAYNTVRTSVSLQTHTDLGQDPVAVQAVAAGARLAMSAGGSYLLANLDPATPAELASTIRTFADNLQAISMYAQAGVSNSDPLQAGRLRDGETASAKIADICK